ncbi:hypothetical protein OCS_04004 [Ophiocordyceps sinensis CO18]|nr:hypothetical protein OCS_04004 [Ophiocordyceps sinensis CO18]
MGALDSALLNARGMTKPLTPLPADADADADAEKRGPGLRGTNLHGGRRYGDFWRRLRCW